MIETRFHSTASVLGGHPPSPPACPPQASALTMPPHPQAMRIHGWDFCCFPVDRPLLSRRRLSLWGCVVSTVWMFSSTSFVRMQVWDVNTRTLGFLQKWQIRFTGWSK